MKFNETSCNCFCQVPEELTKLLRLELAFAKIIKRLLLNSYLMVLWGGIWWRHLLFRSKIPPQNTIRYEFGTNLFIKFGNANYYSIKTVILYKGISTNVLRSSTNTESVRSMRVCVRTKRTYGKYVNLLPRYASKKDITSVPICWGYLHIGLHCDGSMAIWEKYRS